MADSLDDLELQVLALVAGGLDSEYNIHRAIEVDHNWTRISTIRTAIGGLLAKGKIEAYQKGAGEMGLRVTKVTK